jgi:hypothetical protein
VEDDEFERVRQDPDPIRRAKRSTAMIEAYMRRMAELSHLRKDVIEQAQDAGMSYTEMPPPWGIAKGRVTRIRSQAPPSSRPLPGPQQRRVQSFFSCFKAGPATSPAAALGSAAQEEANVLAGRAGLRDG